MPFSIFHYFFARQNSNLSYFLKIMQIPQLNLDQIDYFKAVEQLKSRISSQNLRSCFSQVLKVEPNYFQPSTPIEQELNVSYISIFPNRQINPPNFKSTFDNFLAAVKKTLSTDKYIVFLRYLSLYITGKLSHEIFIRLFFDLFRDGNIPIMKQPIIQYLPSFLASLSCSAFFTKKLNLTASIQDQFAVEAMLNITSSIKSPQISKTISKCLTCLSTGLISKEIAQEWLSRFCNEEFVEQLNDIDDFSYFHPSRFPHELILCPQFLTNEKNSSICQQFVDYETSLKPFSTYKPYLRELCEVKMRGLRKVIRKLAEGAKLSPEELFFAYGNDAYVVADYIPKLSSIVLEHLGSKYEETQSILIKILNYQLSLFSPDNPEFRYQFKRTLKHETFAFHYQLPGERMIDFGTISAAKVAFSIVLDFSKNFFDEPEFLKIQKSLQIISVLINKENKDKVYVVGGNQIYALAYLAAIARLALEVGNTDEVQINSDNSIMDCQQTSHFGMQLAELPKKIKQPTGLHDLFPDYAFQHVDLHITRCVRQLDMFSDENELPEYPEELPSLYIITTMNQVWDDDEQPNNENTSENNNNENQPTSQKRKGGFSIRCCSAFSPCYIEFTSDNSDEPNPGSSSATEKE